MDSAITTIQLSRTSSGERPSKGREGLSSSGAWPLKHRKDIDDAWADLQRETRVFQCLQCHKCTAGCPVSEARDLKTSQIVRLAQLGDAETIYASFAIWRCTGCRVCTTRCPAGVDPAGLQDRLKRRSLELKMPPADVRAYHASTAFLDTVGRYGRLSELGMVRRFKQRTRSFFEQIALGVLLLLRGKIRLLADRTTGRRAVRALIKADRRQRHG